MSKKKFAWPHDRKTLEGLIDEAALRREKAKKAFDKHDNSEDMAELEAWDFVLEWLNGKL